MEHIMEYIWNIYSGYTWGKYWDSWSLLGNCLTSLFHMDCSINYIMCGCHMMSWTSKVARLQQQFPDLQKRQPNAAICKWWMSPSMSSLEDITLTINQSLQKRIQDTYIHIYIYKKYIQGKMHDIPCQQTATYMTMTSLQKKCTPKEWNNIREATWAFPKWYVYIYIYIYIYTYMCVLSPQMVLLPWKMMIYTQKG